MRLTNSLNVIKTDRQPPSAKLSKHAFENDGLSMKTEIITLSKFEKSCISPDYQLRMAFSCIKRVLIFVDWGLLRAHFLSLPWGWYSGVKTLLTFVGKSTLKIQS